MMAENSIAEAMPQIWRRPEVTDIGRRAVLVVHNELCIASSMSELLAYNGVPASSTTHYQRALDLAAAICPALILIDTTPPRENGFALAARLREVCAPDDVVLLALVMRWDPEVRKSLEAAGFDGCWTKPISIRGLVRVFRPEA